MSVKIDLGMCCPCNAPGIDAYRLLTFPDGVQVRVKGLDKIFEEAYHEGKKPHWSITGELVKRLSEYNYIPSSAQFEYEEALLKEFRLFFEKKEKGVAEKWGVADAMLCRKKKQSDCMNV
jgi:hypothetical protein